MPAYDLSSIGAVSAAAELARTHASQEPNQDSYNAGWLHGYADALADAAKQLEPQQELIDAVIGYMGEHNDSAELYAALHDGLGLSDKDILSLGFDLPQCQEGGSRTITVLVVEPMKPCRVQEIGGDLESMQAIVGGYIEEVTPFSDPVAIVCNEEGKRQGLPLNRPLTDRHGVPYDFLRGTFFIAGVEGEHFVSLTDDQIRSYKELYDNMVVLTAEKKPRREKKNGQPGRSGKSGSGQCI